jgi:hypothetical protein
MVDLKLEVLDKFAKSSPHKYLNWKEQKDSLIFEDETLGEFVIEEIERVVELALLVKQAEVLKVVEEFFRERQKALGKDSVVVTPSGQPMDEKIKFKAMVAAALQGDALVMEAVLKKRLLVKSEAKE